ncbi:hypothetical protein ABZS66_55225 [Dactylosporangium sp. NPDC005572]|uniref:alpha/beta hydrolase family protein n=1 Tax=Dactylosporangium sp. NPDC005572 TaxID=3156889 RepID=UPI0033A9B627
MQMTRRTLLGTGTAIAAGTVLLAGPADAAAAMATPALRLPAPTGPYPVGSVDLHLVDRRRTDPLAPTRRPRELMVRLWYPARRSPGPLTPYLGPTLSRLLVGEINMLTDTDHPPDLLTFPTPGRTNAPRAAGTHPLVLFSPGRSTNAAFYTGLLTELASRGLVVAAIDHTFDAPVEFTDGRVELPPSDVDEATLLATRVADVRFVLGRLGDRAAVVGHSLGSRTAIDAIDQDHRFAAGIAIDGNPLGDASLRAPFLLLGNQGHRRAEDPDWAAFYDRLRGPRRHLVVDGAEHHDFTDLTVFKATVDIGGVFELGPIDGRRALAITRTFATAWLTDRSAPLLCGESAQFPEVDFQP